MKKSHLKIIIRLSMAAAILAVPLVHASESGNWLSRIWEKVRTARLESAVDYSGPSPEALLPTEEEINTKGKLQREAVAMEEESEKLRKAKKQLVDFHVIGDQVFGGQEGRKAALITKLREQIPESVYFVAHSEYGMNEVNRVMDALAVTAKNETAFRNFLFLDSEFIALLGANQFVDYSELPRSASVYLRRMLDEDLLDLKGSITAGRISVRDAEILRTYLRTMKTLFEARLQQQKLATRFLRWKEPFKKESWKKVGQKVTPQEQVKVVPFHGETGFYARNKPAFVGTAATVGSTLTVIGAYELGKFLGRKYESKSGK